MKKIKDNIFVFLLGIIVLGACNQVLDTKPSSIYDESTVFGSRISAQAFVFEVYNNVIPGYVEGNITTWECRTPNMINKVQDGQGENTFNTAAMTNDADYGFFGGYVTIRKINMIITKAKEYQGKGLSETDTKELVAEGKLLRALYYYRQARGVGRVVWIDRILTMEDTINNGLKTGFKLTANSDESYKLIIKDLEEAIPDMATSKTPGQLNQGAAYALLSEVCLTAAAYTSDLGLRATWLDRSIAAVTELEKSYSLVSSDLFGSMFNENVSGTLNEVIFAFYKSRATGFTCQSTNMQTQIPNMSNDGMNSDYAVAITGRSDSLELMTKFKAKYNLGYSLAFEAWGTRYPTQSLADAYLMIDESDKYAKLWSETSQFKNAVEDTTYSVLNNLIVSNGPWWGKDYALKNMQSGEVKMGRKAKVAGTSLSAIMYSNRDKRFYATFVHDSSEWYKEKVYTRFRSNLDRYAKADLGYYKSPSGYYLRKACYNNPEGGRAYATNLTDYHWVLFRLGRALLNKAEAQLWKGEYSQAVTTLNKTREQHGGLPPSTATGSTGAWNDYITERRAELAHENDYYWSCLRWGLHGGDANKGFAAKTKAQHLLEEPTFIQLSHNADAFFIAVLSYQDVHKREFREERQYLLPIPKAELVKNPSLGDQNPGWE